MPFQDEEEVVISGIGGKFPEAGNVAELAEKLFAGENLMTRDERKLTKGFYENLPEFQGKTTYNSVLFDNAYFGISPIVSTAMDPLTCQILQRTFEAVIDAGISPSELRGTNASVFSGTCHSDSDLEWATDTRSGYGIMGRNRCMNSNRVSYWLDLNGTSVSTDSGWTNGISNLYLGWSAIRSGKCDVAIVSTASLQWHPLITMQLKDFGFLSEDGICRTFDDEAGGFGRSSAVVVLVLQRAREARRWYATIGHIYSSCFGEREGVISRPTQREWEQLLREFYEQAKVDVREVEYVEVNGSSLREEDAAELNAIDAVFCRERERPLLVGCVKSNLGHAEASSSFCGIVKAVISLEKGIIPQNLHYRNPNALCPALARGQIKVVDRNTALPPGGWVAVNSHSFGGTYAHILLKANPKRKTQQHDGIPRLVLLADRINDYMEDLLEKVESVPFDPEFVALLHEIHSRRIEKYLGRGYTILPRGESAVHEHQAYGQEKRPLWFVFSGMGSQWPRMGKRLMDLPVFRESIERSHELLSGKGLDLIRIITTEDAGVFDNILHSFVGIAAIQVALVDVLRALNVTADGFIGHSVGELGCAYADGCFTAEQMVLAAYYRGRASTETELIRGSMAAVGKGYDDIKDQLPDGVEVACHNSEDSCTLSGPVDLVHDFVAHLKDKGIFAKSVNVANIAYHSRYIRPAAPKLLSYLKQVVTHPKPRSPKWISTSNPEPHWDTDLAKYCSAEYHTNNLLSPVLFQEGAKHIPKNAICVEIAPHGLLQPILKRSLGEHVTNIPLTSRSAEDPLVFLLQAVGRMYMAGVDPCIVNLYPKLQYPVSRGTHVLHHLVHWHEQLSATVVTPMEKKVVYSFKRRLVEVADDGTGYVANGHNIYPMSMFLKLAWDIFASLQKKPIEECPVVFQDFHLDRPLIVHLSEEDNVVITFESGSGKFEIMADSLLATGTVSLLKERPLRGTPPPAFTPDLLRDDIYSELRRKGFAVGEHFKTLSAVSFGEKVLRGKIPLKSNWVQSIESLIQLHLLTVEPSSETIVFPRSLQRLEIACGEHGEYRSSVSDGSGESSVSGLSVSYDVLTNTASCGGIEMRGLKGKEVPRERSSLKFPSTKFFPLMDPPLESSLSFAEVCFSLLLDNIGANEKVMVVNVMEVASGGESSIGTYLQQSFKAFKIKVKVVADPSEVNNDKMDFIITPESFLDQCRTRLIDSGFLLLKGNSTANTPLGFRLIGRFQQTLLLKKDKTHPQDPHFIHVDGNPNQLEALLRQLKPSPKLLHVVCYKEPAEGLTHFKRRMQAETVLPLRWIFILDPTAPPFDSANPFYSQQLRKGLATNVYQNGCWGGYREYNFSDSALQDDVNLILEPSEEVSVRFVSFDLRESLLKLRQVEYSGRMNGAKVMGLSRLTGHRRLVWEKYLTWEVPESWSLEEAGSAAMAYALAYYCLVLVGKTKKRERVLVTDGLSCLGRACIAVASRVASRVFVTVNNSEEAEEVRKVFPQLKESDVISHEEARFDLGWKLRMRESFAEVIINTLEGKRFFSVLNLTGQYGRIFHFGEQEARSNEQLGSSVFLKSVALHSNPTEVMMRMSEEEKRALHGLVSEGIREGVVRPLPRMVVSLEELKRVQREIVGRQHRVKVLVGMETVEQNAGYVRFDTRSSYVVVGDETDVWIDVVEWLIHRGVQHIVVSARNRSNRTRLRLPHLTSHNVLLRHHDDLTALLRDARQLGPISAAYYISMNSPDVTATLIALDSLHRTPGAHLLAITKARGSVSDLCAARNEAGLPSTNFVWDAEDIFINEHLEFMGKLCGRAPAIHVSPLTAMSKSDHKLIDLVPSAVEDFCQLGASLEEEVRVLPLNTLSGGNREAVKEFTPLVFVPGLQKDPVGLLQPVVSGYLYPAFCVQVPNMRVSIPTMASLVLPEILKMSSEKVFNIVGVSWGTHLAMELTKRLEEVGATVGLILVEGPFLNARALVTKSVESDLLNLIQECSKATVDIQLPNEVISEKTWPVHLNATLSLLNLPEDKQNHFSRAATFIYNNLRALIDHDTTTLSLKGPLTVLVSEGHSFDDRSIWKLSKSVCIRPIPATSDDLFASSDAWRIIHGSAISQAMSKHTVHDCSFSALEEFMTQKVILKLSHDFQAANIKFSFTC